MSKCEHIRIDYNYHGDGDYYCNKCGVRTRTLSNHVLFTYFEKFDNEEIYYNKDYVFFGECITKWVNVNIKK